MVAVPCKYEKRRAMDEGRCSGGGAVTETTGLKVCNLNLLCKFVGVGKKRSDSNLTLERDNNVRNTSH